MGYILFNCFTKITGWLIQLFSFRTKIYYENRSIQSRRISGKAIIVCNHTSLKDYPLIIFVFISRTVRALMAEVLYEKIPLRILVTLLGGIRVDRNQHDMSSLFKAEKILNNGGVVLVFPESRLPRKGETSPLPYKVGAAWLSLATGAPVVPIYTNGKYFNKERTRVVIGAPILPETYDIAERNQKENVSVMTEAIKDKIVSLGEYLDNVSH